MKRHRRRVGSLDAGHRRDKPVAARGNGLDTAPFRAALVEHAAEGGDLNRQIGILDHRRPPDGRHDLLFGA